MNPSYVTVNVKPSEAALELNPVTISFVILTSSVAPDALLTVITPPVTSNCSLISYSTFVGAVFKLIPVI